MPAKATSTPNIALIKYWGNRVNDLRLPAADSLSMTLNSPHVTVTVDHAPELSVESFASDGTKHSLSGHHVDRFKKHVELTKRYLAQLGFADLLPRFLTMKIVSEIPSGVGLASSAAVFSAVAEAIGGLVSQQHNLTREEISVIARLGSGSAARSIYGGYTALIAGTEESLDAACARHIASEEDWLLHDIVVIPSIAEKKVGSTEGHALADTSPQYADRLKAIPRRMKECIDAIQTKDFEKLQSVSEEDSLDMHEVMRTSTPPLNYLSQETHRIIEDITLMRQNEHIPVLYTMDAGPTVHLICPAEGLAAVQAFAHAQKGCKIFETKVGKGSHLI